MQCAPEAATPEQLVAGRPEVVSGLDRRDFLGQVTMGAMTIAAASISATVPVAAHASPAPARTPVVGGAPFSDAWLSKLNGKHRQFFDAVEPNDGFALVFAMNFLNLNHDTYALTDQQLTAVVGLRHLAMPMALSDAMWARYKLGDTFKVMDPATKAPAVRNPFLHADGVAFPGATIPALVGRGVIFTVCNVALTLISGKVSGNANVSADVAKQEWTAGLVPGMTLVPVGVMAVNLAQEHGCTYCYGG
jgi:hypothetical protein